MRSKRSPGEYLAFLCVKHEVDPDSFFRALVSASKNRISTRNGLSINADVRRKKTWSSS